MAQQLLNITGGPNGNKYTYSIHKHPNSTKKSKLTGSFGTSITMYSDVTGNCQLGSIQVALKLTNLTIPEFKEFWETIFYKNNPAITSRPGTWRKSTVMVDVTDNYVRRLVYRFEKMGAYIRAKRPYTNRTGSKMTMMLIDLRGKREGVDPQ